MTWTRSQIDFDQQQRLLAKLAERVKAFHGLSTAEIGAVLTGAERCNFEPGMAIINEGNVGTHMYVIIEGRAVVTKAGRDGDVELARLEPADSFGEMALADNEVRSATVTALEPCVLVRVDDRVFRATPDIALKIYRNIAAVLAERLRNADELLAWRL